jgi:hypothetical protein
MSMPLPLGRVMGPRSRPACARSTIAWYSVTVIAMQIAAVMIAEAAETTNTITAIPPIRVSPPARPGQPALLPVSGVAGS